MDELISATLNSYVGRYPWFDELIGNIGGSYFKLLPILMIAWGFWFTGAPGEERTRRREAILATLLVAYPAAAVSRALAKMLPYSERPLHDARFDFVTSPDVGVNHLEGWSSMPSDHAAIFFAIAFSFFAVSRWGGLAMVLHSLVAVGFVRVYFAWHWTSDILGGMAVGLVSAVVLYRLLRRILTWLRIVPFFEKREWLAYPLLFSFTYEIASWFKLSDLIITRALASL